MVSVVVDLEKCTGEGTCVDTCPVAVFELEDIDGNPKAVVIAEDQCIDCQACVVQCPEAAITVTS